VTGVYALPEGGPQSTWRSELQTMGSFGGFNKAQTNEMLVNAQKLDLTSSFVGESCFF